MLFNYFSVLLILTLWL